MEAAMLVSAVADLETVLSVLLLRSLSNHLPQLKFFRELSAERTQILDKLMAGSYHSVLGRDLAISLDAQHKLGNQGMRDLNDTVVSRVLVGSCRTYYHVL